MPFYDGIRAHLYQAFRSEAREGDWWCLRLDGDEFYLDDPLEFLARVPASRHYVCKDSVEYRLTPEDLSEQAFVGHFPEDMPHIRYHLPLTFAEARFFRHRARLDWDLRLPFPRRMGLVYEQKIRSKHYPHRSPAQMQLRLDTRNEARRRTGIAWAHERATDYRELLLPRSELVRAPESRPHQTRGCMNPHLHSLPGFWVKRILHGLGIWP